MLSKRLKNLKSVCGLTNHLYHHGTSENQKKSPTITETTAADELQSHPVVIKKAVVITNDNDNAKSNSEHCYDLETDHDVLECLK